MNRVYYIILIPMLLLSCATSGKVSIMHQGTIYSLKDGSEMNLEISLLYADSGTMKAFNSKTGEIFTGPYKKISKKNTSQGTITNSFGITIGAVETTSGDGQNTVKGVLKGDKGTIISISLDIEIVRGAHVSYKGYGDAKDNHGVSYQVHLTPEWKEYKTLQP